MPESELADSQLSVQPAVNLSAVAADATPWPAPEIEHTIQQVATAFCVDIESSMDAAAASAKMGGYTHSAEHRHAIFKTVVHLSTPFLNIRDALAL